MSAPSTLTAFSADGHEATWSTWDGEHDDHLSLTWENEAWTAVGRLGRERVEYVVRIAPTWEVRQFLLFRDLDQPDLWLAIDARHRWGEVNGAYRDELDGCHHVELACTAFTSTIPIRRLDLAVGGDAEVDVIEVDVDTLGVTRATVRYDRIGEHRYRRTDVASGTARQFDVDKFGLVLDDPGRFRRRTG